MALSKVTSMINQAMYETQLETIEKLRSFLKTKDDVDEEFMDELLNEFKSKIEEEYKVDSKAVKKAVKKAENKKVVSKKKSDSGEGSDNDSKSTTSDSDKKKKKSSAYTLFIQYKMTDNEFKEKVKKDNPDAKGNILMKKATEAWGEVSEDVKKKMRDIYKDNADITGKELYEKAME